jgi:hypothetical protein
LAKVQANHKALASCAGPHDFSIDVTPTKTFGKRWRCSLCQGEIDSIAKIYYTEGLQHGLAKARQT